jgi:hypothetical protein
MDKCARKVISDEFSRQPITLHTLTDKTAANGTHERLRIPKEGGGTLSSFIIGLRKQS